MKISKSWRNKPLFRRQGDVRFKTGMEAATLLVGEANRRDAHETEFIASLTSTLTCLTPIFERNPRYAFVAKQLMEPERFIQFRVAWIDDVGVVRMNRGWRIQYSSSIGPYEGALHFGSHINTSVIKALGFDAVFSNAVTGFDVGAAVGGSDFNPCDKSDAELQRFCQSFMTELAKYVGPDCDSPWMGMGVGEKEMGYLFGQYKRITNQTSTAGRPFLSGGKKNLLQGTVMTCLSVYIHMYPYMLIYTIYPSTHSFIFSFLYVVVFLHNRHLDSAWCTLPTKCSKIVGILSRGNDVSLWGLARSPCPSLRNYKNSGLSLLPFPMPRVMFTNLTVSTQDSS